jgi:hypothetical protein
MPALEIFIRCTIEQSIRIAREDEIPVSRIVSSVKGNAGYLSSRSEICDFIMKVGELYTIVRLSKLRHRKGREMLWNIYREHVCSVASVMELEDESFEIVVLQSYRQTFQDGLSKVFHDCKVDPDYNPIKPSVEDLQRMHYDAVKHQKIESVSRRAAFLFESSQQIAAAYYFYLLAL